MIFTDRTIIVQKGTSSINDTIILYRGDKGVEIRFTLNEGSPFRFGSGASPNIIEKTEAAYGQLVIKTPNNLPSIFSEIVPTNKGKIIFTITAEMIDEITEVGNYTFQIRLFDESMNSRATLPEVKEGIEIREPIAAGDITNTNEVDIAAADYAITVAATPEDAFDGEGNYNKTTWGTGDLITSNKLNKIETGIEGVNQKVATEHHDVSEIKADINTIKTDLGTGTLNTTAKDVKGAINEIAAQCKDAASKDNVKWRPLDKGYITIIFDDFNDDLADIFALFQSKNIPLSCAIPAIKIAQGKDISVLHDIENNGGEIFAHGYTSNPITASSSTDFIKSEFEQSKYLLEKNGLHINGYVRAGGNGSIAFTNILDLFYKNYIYGFSMDEDELLFGRNSLQITLDEFKSKVDNAIANKQWIKFYAHGFHEVPSELLTQMMDYINSSGIVPVTYATMYSKFAIGNLTAERNVTKSDNLSAFKYTKEIDDRTLYREDVNLLKNSAWVDFTNDSKWVKDKTNYSNYVYWNTYDRGFYTALRVTFGDKATTGSVKIYQDIGLSRATLGEVVHLGLTVQQQSDNNSITLRLYKQLDNESELTLVAEKTYTGRLSDEYISVEWVSNASRDVTNYRYEIEVTHPDETSSNLTFLYLPRLTLKRLDNRYNGITY